MRGSVNLLEAMAVALLASVGALLALPIGAAQGAVTLPSGFTQSQVVSGLTDPTDMEFAPRRQAVCGRAGGQGAHSEAGRDAC
jgi:hypothetical protein